MKFLKLYDGARSRGSIVRWYLEELSISYEFVLLDMAVGKHLQPEYLGINLMGKVPATILDYIKCMNQRPAFQKTIDSPIN